MNCKYMNMLRVVRGNAFKLKIAVEAYTPSGRRIDSFALGEAVLKLDKNGTLTTKEYTILEGTTILVAFDGSDSLGVYGFQMSGEYEGEAWRWANAEIFQIVESNVKAHIPDGCVLLDDTYNMALKIVLSGGDGVTFTPSVSEQGIISWTNDGGLPNPEPRNIRGPRGEQGPQGEVGPQGPRGQMGLRGQIGPKGDKGDKGDTGATPVLDVTASVDENVGNPMVVVESFGPAEHRTFDFQFKNLKGQKGETGATGPQGPQGQQGEPGNYTKPASGIPLSDLNGNVASGIVYDVTANNSGATFASLSALLSSGSLSTLIPTDVRKGGMQIRFVCSSDNKYVQFRLMKNTFSTTVSDWQGVDENPTSNSHNLVESCGAAKFVLDRTSVYKKVPISYNTIIESLLDVSISNPQNGYLYWLSIAKAENGAQQLTIFKSSESSPRTYVSFKHIVNKSSGSTQDTGINDYTGTIDTNTVTKVRINWDLVPFTTQTQALYPDLYEFRDWVFLGGRIAECLPIDGDEIVDNSVSSNKLISVDGSKLVDGSISSVKLASVDGSKIADNSISSNKLISVEGSKIVDASVANDKLIDESISRVKLKDNSISVKELSVFGYKPNLISPDDFKTPSSIWSSGQIDQKGNSIDGNIVKFTATGSSASWQAYLTCFLKVADIKSRTGIDIPNAVSDYYIDLELHGNRDIRTTWVALRYVEDDSPSFYSSGDKDAVFNASGGQQGLGSSDSTTWAEREIVISGGNKDYSLSNLKIPYTYNNKHLYAILFCFCGGDNGIQKIINNIGIHIHNGDKKTFAFYTQDKEITEINHRIDGVVEDVTDIQGLVPPVGEGGYYAAIGDSITHANHTSIYDIDENDPYNPIDGYAGTTYKRKNYAYYLSKKFNLKWANYGYGGSTLSNAPSKAYPTSFLHPFVEDNRIKSLKEGVDWDYISIFFGWNDAAFAPIHFRDIWLQETYGEDIGYPVNSSQIGQTGFATQAQKDACDAVTGTVGGVQYNTNKEYFMAQFVGSIDDSGVTTWYGAWNYTMDYLMRTYPNAKFLIVAPFLDTYDKGGGHSYSNIPNMLREPVINIANRYQVPYLDFEDIPYWYDKADLSHFRFANPDDPQGIGYWYTVNGNTCEPTIGGFHQSVLSYDKLHPSNTGYKTLAGPFGKALIFS